jgi:hypothetical protein
METMTAPEDKDREALERLDDALVEDIIAASDKDILVEAKQDGIDPETLADSLRTMFENIVIAKRKERLLAAKAEVAADHRRSVTAVSSNPIEARQLLERLLARHPETAGKLTMAARKGKAETLSDDEVYGLLEDFRDVGISLTEGSDDER